MNETEIIIRVSYTFETPERTTCKTITSDDQWKFLFLFFFGKFLILMRFDLWWIILRHCNTKSAVDIKIRSSNASDFIFLYDNWDFSTTCSILLERQIWFSK